MLCFLPPLPASGPPRRRPDKNASAAATIITAIAALALLTPFGWVRTQPLYEMRVGVPARLAWRSAERAPAPRAVYRAGADGRIAIPPGLAVEAATGALVGVPTLAGTYTVGLAVSRGASRPVAGPLFRVRVRPST